MLIQQVQSLHENIFVAMALCRFAYIGEVRVRPKMLRVGLCFDGVVFTVGLTGLNIVPIKLQSYSQHFGMITISSGFICTCVFGRMFFCWLQCTRNCEDHVQRYLWILKCSGTSL